MCCFVTVYSTCRVIVQYVHLNLVNVKGFFRKPSSVETPDQIIIIRDNLKVVTLFGINPQLDSFVSIL